MIRFLIERGLRRLERQLGGSLDYLRFLSRASLPAFFRFCRFLPMAGHRRRIPAEVWHVATLAASCTEDCGECFGMGARLAVKEGLEPGVVEAILREDGERLPHEFRDAWSLATSVARGEDVDPEVRQRLVELHGEAGLAELALGIASARVFPAVKRTLGFAGGACVSGGWQVGSVPAREASRRASGPR